MMTSWASYGRCVTMSDVTIDERAAVIGASLCKKNAAAYYAEKRTHDGDILHAMARKLNEDTDVDWSDLDDVSLAYGTGGETHD